MEASSPSGPGKVVAAAALVLALLLLITPGSPIRQPWTHVTRVVGHDDGDQVKLIAGGRRAGPGAADGGMPGDVFERFHWALRYINSTQPRGVYPVWQCRDEDRVGTRPPNHTPDIIGSTCEPWIAREVITLLHALLLPGTAKALEWSSGSSTVWLLRGHVAHLTSIEHHPQWSVDVQKAVKRIFGEEFVKERWDFHHIPTTPPNSKELEDPKIFADYVAAAFLPDSAKGTFDFISIDGRARTYCFPRALEMLKPHGGVLMLDNSERSYYWPGMETVPKHWPRYDAKNRFHTTTVWVSCEEGRC